MRRLFSAFVVAVCLASGLGACSGSEGGTSPNTTLEPNQDQGPAGGRDAGNVGSGSGSGRGTGSP